MKYLLITILFFAFAAQVQAANYSSIKFFSSNNTSELNLEAAYQRLVGQEQCDLQDVIIDIAQKNHLEQGEIQKILGLYQMQDNQHNTIENSDVYITSPFQAIEKDKIIDLAKHFVLLLKQESIAVFIPENESPIAEVMVTFNSPHTIQETIALIKTKLPDYYAQAFSLHLIKLFAGLNGTQVKQIEWLGSKINLTDIKEAFPNEAISTEKGEAFLVFKNGQMEKL